MNVPRDPALVLTKRDGLILRRHVRGQDPLGRDHPPRRNFLERSGRTIAFRSLGFEVDPERDLAEVERQAARIFTQPVHDCLSSRRLLEQLGEQRELLGSAERFKSTIDAVAG